MQRQFLPVPIYDKVREKGRTIMKKAYLVLNGGPVLEGYAFGADGEAVGELVFTTGVVGYPETLTDPCYAGQIVLQTFPLIGCYGIIPEDISGKCTVSGYVAREVCASPSNFRCEKTLDAYLKEQGVPGICGVDTRELTRLLRENGTVFARITDTVPEGNDVCCVPAVRPADSLSVTEKKWYPAAEEKYHVAVIDYGCADSLVPVLQALGCSVTVLPHTLSAEEILAEGADGVILSGGPGDPAAYSYEIEQTSVLAGRVPLFAIGLGHQILALAHGGKTEKLLYGHRGANQPVRDLIGTRTYITQQNHGYTVTDALPDGGVLRYVNRNDGSCEGIDYPALRAFSVQFTPAACGGSADKEQVFARFLAMMGGEF